MVFRMDAGKPLLRLLFERYFQESRMTKSPEPTLEFDGKQYIFSSLSDQAKMQIGNIRTTEQEIARLQVQLGIAQAARSAFLQALKAQLPAT